MKGEAYAAWIAAKEKEAQAVEERRAIEDWLLAEFRLPSDAEGTESREEDGFKVKIVARMNRKVDAELVKELAEANGLDTANLIRWKPELNLTAWKSAAKNITELLAPAIVTTPGRPSFTIERME
jgi:hypothetical protein